MMRNIGKKSIIVIAWIVIFLCGPPVWGLSPTVFTLENGLKVILQENRSAPVVAIQVWVGTGSADERDDEAGISHVLEHMMFKGTVRRSVGEISRTVEGAGGSINAATSSDYTMYYIVIPSREFETGVDILADAIQHSMLDDGEIEREREVVLEEVRRSDDRPFGRLIKDFFKTAYRHHPYRRPVIGFEKVIRQLRRTDLVDYIKRWYKPANMTLVIVGDVDLTRAEKVSRHYFGGIPPGPVPERRRAVEPPQKAQRSAVLSGDVSKSYLVLGWHIPGVRHEDIYALDILALILGQGKSSRLYREVLSRRQLVQMITSTSYTPLDTGLFWIQATLEPGNDRLLKALEAILGETYSLKSTPVKSTELEKARLNLESDFIFGKQTMQGQARSFGYFQTVIGNVDFERQYLKRIRQVDENDLLRVARRYLRTENLTIALLKPKGISAPTHAELEGIARKAEHESHLSEPVRADAEPHGVRHRVMPGGMTLIIKKKSDVPIVALRAVFLGGVRFETPENNGINNFIARMLTRGTTSRSAEAIASEVESIAGRMEGFSGLNSFGVEAEFLSRFLDRGLEIFTDVLLRPSFDPEEMEKTRRLILSAIDQIQDHPDRLVMDRFGRNLFRVHPYRMRMQGTRESVSRLSVRDLRSYYTSYAVPSNLVLAVVGDVEPEMIEERLHRLFAGFQAEEFAAPIIPREPRATEIRKEHIPRDSRQAYIILGFLGASLDSPDRFALEVLDNILSGMGGRLFTRLRDRNSLAYSVTSFNRLGLDPGSFGVYMGTAPEKLKQALSGILRELQEVRDHMVTQQELERAKRFIIGHHFIGLQRNSSQAAELAFNTRYGLGIDYTKQYLQKIQSVTREDVLKIAQRYINLDGYTLTIVGQ